MAGNIDLGTLFFTTEHKTKGAAAAQAEMRNFQHTVGKTAAEIKAMQAAADRKGLERLKKKFRDGKISADQFFGSMNKGQRQMFKFEDATKKVKVALDRGLISQSQYNDAIKRARIQFLGGAHGIRNLDTKMQELTKSVQIALGPLSGVASRITAITTLASLGTLKLAAYAAGFIGLGFAIIKTTGSAANFEENLLKVAKTTNLSGKQLEDLGDSVKTLGPKLGQSSTALLNIASQVGQLGVVGKRNILGFTTAVGLLLKTTNLTADEAAIKLARLINVTTTTQGEVRNVAAALVGLGNASAATEKEILKFATEIGQTTSQFNVSAEAALGWGAVLASLGARAEGASSVMGRTLRKLEGIVRTTGKGFKELSILTGIAGKDMQKAIKEDALGFLGKFIDGLGRVNTDLASLSQVLEIFGLKGDEINRILPLLAQNSDLVAKSLNKGVEEFNKGTAAEIEFENASKGFNAQLEKLKSALGNVSTEIGSNFLPLATEMIKALRSLVGDGKTLAKVIEHLAVLIGSIGLAVFGRFLVKIAAGLAGVAVAGKAANAVIKGLKFVFTRAFLGLPGLIFLAAEAILFLVGAFGDSKTATEQWNDALQDNIAFLNDLKGASEETRAELRIAAKQELEDLETKIRLQKAAIERVSGFGGVTLAELSGGADEEDLQKLQMLENQLGLIEGRLKAINLEATKEKFREGFVPKKQDEINLKPPQTDAELAALKKIEAAKAANATVAESLILLDLQAAKTLEGSEALDAFNENLARHNKAQAFANKLRQIPGEEGKEGESDADFIKRKQQAYEDFLLTLERLDENQKEVARSALLMKEQFATVELDKEILALRSGTEAWEDYKESRVIDKQVEAYEKSLSTVIKEKDVVKEMGEERRRQLETRDALIEKNKEILESEKRIKAAVNQISEAFGAATESALLNFTSFGDIFQALEQDLLRILTRLIIIQPMIDAMNASMGGGGGFFGFLGMFGGGTSSSGGGVNPGDIQIAHKGGKVGNGRIIPIPSMGIGGTVGEQLGLSPNEELTVLHKGETVRTTEQESELSRMMGGGGGDTFSITLNGVVDADSFNQNSSQIQTSLAQMVAAARGS